MIGESFIVFNKSGKVSELSILALVLRGNGQIQMYKFIEGEIQLHIVYCYMNTLYTGRAPTW